MQKPSLQFSQQLAFALLLFYYLVSIAQLWKTGSEGVEIHTAFSLSDCFPVSHYLVLLLFWWATKERLSTLYWCSMLFSIMGTSYLFLSDSS